MIRYVSSVSVLQIPMKMPLKWVYFMQRIFVVNVDLYV